MTIDVVPQTRIDHLVTGVDGASLRRTDHRGIAWYGGRQQAQVGGAMVMRHQAAGIVSPFWLPDTLAYRTEFASSIIVTISAAAIYFAENCALADISASLAVNESQPAWSQVLVHLQGVARIPIGVSYDVTVLAPVDAVGP